MMSSIAKLIFFIKLIGLLLFISVTAEEILWISNDVMVVDWFVLGWGTMSLCFGAWYAFIFRERNVERVNRLEDTVIFHLIQKNIQLELNNIY